MRNLRSILSVLIAVSLILGCQTDRLSKARILDVANDLAVREGSDPASMIVVYEATNKTWLEHQHLMSKLGGSNAQLSALKDREYQAVGYFPTGPVLGGVLWVFVDRSTGEVITFFGEE